MLVTRMGCYSTGWCVNVPDGTGWGVSICDGVFLYSIGC